MFVPLLVLRNAFRHRLRTTLTVVGIIVAIAAFGLLRTIVDAWYAGANASSSACPIARRTCPTSCPAVSSSASRSRAL